VAEKVCIARTLSGEFRRSFEGVLKGVLTFRVYVSKGSKKKKNGKDTTTATGIIHTSTSE
jgi:hypothetical protein